MLGPTLFISNNEQGPNRQLTALSLTLKDFIYLSGVCIVEFEQVKSDWSRAEAAVLKNLQRTVMDNCYENSY